MKPLLQLILIIEVIVSMYQDADPNRTVVVVDRDGVTKFITIDNKELDKPNLIDKIERIVYGIKKP